MLDLRSHFVSLLLIPNVKRDGFSGCFRYRQSASRARSDRCVVSFLHDVANRDQSFRTCCQLLQSVVDSLFGREFVYHRPESDEA